MRRTLVSLSVLITLSVLAAAPVMAADRSPEGERIRFPGGDGQLSGFLATPKGKGPHPAVVVIHEWWGLNDWIMENTRELAARGYVALAVDLYRGEVAEDRQLAHELMRGLPREQAIADMKAAVKYLRGRKDVDPDRVGSLGWCMGGGYSLALALAEPLKATVICYGRIVTDAEKLKALKGPVLGVFGESDRGIPVEGVRKFEAALEEAGVEASVSLYDGGHAFMNPGNEGGYNKESAEAAWARIFGFLDAELGKSD